MPDAGSGNPGAVVVTGATSGIGRALALEFHRRGFVVYATGRDRTALDTLAAQGLRTAVLDVTDPDGIARFQNTVTADGARVRILVNNAGYGLMGPLAELPIAEVRRQFEVNTFAPLLLVQAFLPVLAEVQDARIVNVGSVSGVLATPFAGAYCGSKSALHGLSDVLRMELAPFRIRGGYSLLALQRAVPARLRDRLLARRFRLNTLTPGQSSAMRAEAS